MGITRCVVCDGCAAFWKWSTLGGDNRQGKPLVVGYGAATTGQDADTIKVLSKEDGWGHFANGVFCPDCQPKETLRERLQKAIDDGLIRLDATGGGLWTPKDVIINRSICKWSTVHETGPHHHTKVVRLTLSDHQGPGGCVVADVALPEHDKPIIMWCADVEV